MWCHPHSASSARRSEEEHTRLCFAKARIKTGVHPLASTGVIHYTDERHYPSANLVEARKALPTRPKASDESGSASPTILSFSISRREARHFALRLYPGKPGPQRCTSRARHPAKPGWFGATALRREDATRQTQDSCRRWLIRPSYAGNPRLKPGQARLQFRFRR